MIQKNYDPVELVDSADEIKEESQAVYYTDEELFSLKEDLTKLVLEKSRIENISKMIKEIFNQDHINHKELVVQIMGNQISDLDDGNSLGLKSLSSSISSMLTEIRLGYRSELRNVYFMKDYDNAQVHKYDYKGNHVFTRSMHPDERQSTIFKELKNAK
jgi:hypothetical protein